MIVSSDNPGVSELYEDDQGRTVYDIVELLKKVGLYEAEVREDNPDEGDPVTEDNPLDDEHWMN